MIIKRIINIGLKGREIFKLKSIKKITNCFFNYGWIAIIPLKIILNEFDLIFYLLTSLAIAFLSLKLILRFIDRLIYPDFYKDLDHANQLKH